MNLETWDRDLFRAIHLGLHRDWLDKGVLLVTYTGDGWFNLTVIFAMLVWNRSRGLGWACLAAFLSSGLVQIVVKQLVQRPRPSNYDWAQPLESIYGSTSFPSGHSTTTFAIAFMVAWLVQGTRYANWGWGLVGWACLVGFSRIYIGVHYPGDVLGGISIAAVMTSLLYLFGEKKGWNDRVRARMNPSLDTETEPTNQA